MKIFNYKDARSVDVIKNDITSLIRPKSKRFFKIHDPGGLRYLFQFVALEFQCSEIHFYDFEL